MKKGYSFIIEVSGPVQLIPKIRKKPLHLTFMWLWFGVYFVNYGYSHLMNDLEKVLLHEHHNKEVS